MRDARQVTASEPVGRLAAPTNVEKRRGPSRRSPDAPPLSSVRCAMPPEDMETAPEGAPARAERMNRARCGGHRGGGESDAGTAECRSNKRAVWPRAAGTSLTRRGGSADPAFAAAAREAESYRDSSRAATASVRRCAVG